MEVTSTLIRVTGRGVIRKATKSSAGQRRLPLPQWDSDLEWVTSHVWRKTTASILDGSGVTARIIADQLGHSRCR